MTKILSIEDKQQSEEWGAWKFVSEMFDVPHPDKDLANCGIYNTSKCYEQIHDFVVEQKAKDRTALLTELRDSELLEDEKDCGNCNDCESMMSCPRKESHNTLARAIKAHINNLINLTSV